MTFSNPTGILEGKDAKIEFRLSFNLVSRLVMTFFTGVYAAIFMQTIVPILRKGGQKIYAGVLSLLFLSVNAYTGFQWYSLRRALVSHNDTPAAMVEAFDYMNNQIDSLIVVDTTMLVSIILADIILVWRCYVIWMRPKAIIGVFSLLFLVDIVMVSILIVPDSDVPSAVPTCLFLSFTITALASSLIIYRILTLSKGTGTNASKYLRTIEIVAESGVLYAIPLLIVSVTMVVCTATEKCGPFTPIQAAYVNWHEFLLPMTGIAPTLIAFRVETGRARDESFWSQSHSELQFRQTRSMVQL